MKPPKITRLTLFTLSLVFAGMFSLAQVPEKISYQTVVRDASGDLVRSQVVGIQISILKGQVTGTDVYVETHAPTTNINGLVSIEIGGGAPVSGTFSGISWGSYSYYLKMEIDPSGGTSYTITGTSEILSTPYAFYAKEAETVETETQTLSDVAALGNAVNTQLKSVTDPTDDQDAATKAYVDSLFSLLQLLQNGFIDPRDGNQYNTVLIGSQLWMAENLAYLPSVSSPVDGSEIDPFYYVYDYDGINVSAAKATENYQTYGVLYNWPAALIACPTGWHLPSDAEWTILTDYLENNGYGYGGSGDDIAKAMAATSDWAINVEPGNVGNDLSSNNDSGYSALPGGLRNNIGNFFGIEQYAYWWSATETGTSEAWYRNLSYSSSVVNRSSFTRMLGFSVRCVKDE
ncbi:MAG: hypothetical protein K9H26_09285 [Prolixibacteraceae bacterium]|nr:hypothetical protein [Prolixibacteraceae bacterium]